MTETDTVPNKASSNRKQLGFLYAVPIGILGGLIGLGGAEFRLPVLAGPLGYSVHQSVPLNLAISLITVVASIAIRGHRLSFLAMVPLIPAIGALICGAAVTAFVCPTLVNKIPAGYLERIILTILVLLGMAFIFETLLPETASGLLSLTIYRQITIGILSGLVIGLFSSLLGVAGGEFIIPTLVFAFGADIKTAGTASLVISLPTVIIGLARYASHGAFVDKRIVPETVLPMGFGSVVGAVIGGLLVGIVQPAALKITLGIILLVSAARTFKWKGNTA